MVDAYQDITIPFQMSSLEFFNMVKQHLNEDGIMVVNMNMYSDKEGNINDYISDTIANVFENVYTINVKGTTNKELFATQNKDIKNISMQKIKLLKDDNLKNLMQYIYENMELYKKGNYILTDDKAPVELLGIQVIDELIQKEVTYYKKIFKTKGLNGLLESL